MPAHRHRTRNRVPLVEAKTPRQRPSPAVLTRFLTKVEVSTEDVPGDCVGRCWLWTASTDDNGYGRFKFEGRDMGAHRFSYVGFRPDGALEDGEEVDHLCNVHNCVNPDHLTKQTQTWHRGQGGRRGAKVTNAKVTNAKVTNAKANHNGDADAPF